MKKLIVLLAAVMIFAAGCAGKSESQEQVDNIEDTAQAEEQEPEVQAEANGTDNGQNENVEKINSEEEQPVKIAVYQTDDQGGEIISQQIEVAVLDEQSIWQALQNSGMVPSDSKVLSMIKDESGLVLDVDARFGEYLRDQGTTGEEEILKSVTYTYLEAFSAEKIKITEEGQTLVTGHKEVEGYKSKNDY